MLSIEQSLFTNLLVLVVLTFIATGQKPNNITITSLPLNKAVEREIKADEEHIYSIKLKEGAVLRLELEEGTDVNYVFRLIRADGQTITESDLTMTFGLPSITFGLESITYIASAKEELKVLVKAPEKVNGSAKYKLRATVSKKATELDRETIRAEELLREVVKLVKDASKLSRTNRVENYKKATELAAEALVLRRKQADKYWESWVLTFFGVIAADKTGKLNYYNQALEVIEPDNNKTVEANILNNIGIVYDISMEFAKAVEFYNQALLLYKTTQAINSEALIYMDLGRIYTFFLKEPKKAIENYNRALEIFRNVNNKARQANALSLIGSVYANNFDDKAKARDYYDQSLSIHREIGSKRGEARILELIGDTYKNSADHKKGLDYYNQALPLHKEVGAKDAESDLLRELGDYFYKYENKNQQKWLDYYNQALAILKNGTKSTEIMILRRVGDKLKDSGDYQKALEFYNQALSVYELASKNDNQSLTQASKTGILKTISELYRMLGNEKKRSEYENLALGVSAHTTKDKSFSTATDFGIRAVIAERQKDFQKALDLQNQALSIYREMGDKENEIHKLLVISRIYLELGDKQKMLDYQNQALALSKNFNNDRIKISVFRDIADNNKLLGDNQKALEFYNQALSLSKSVVGFGGYDLASLLSGIGKVYETFGEKQKSIEFYRQAISVYRSYGSKGAEGEVLESIGNIYLSSKDYGKAIDFFNEALQLYKGAGSREAAAKTLSNNMSVWQMQGNNQRAILDGKQSVNTYQELRQSTKEFDKETKESYSKKIEPTYRKLADILISEGRFPEAQAVLDLLKEEEFKQFVRKSGEPLFTLPYSGQEEEAIKIVDRLAATGRELSDLKAKPKETLSTEETTRLDYLERNEIPAANKALRLAIESLSKAAPDVANALAVKMKDNNIQSLLPSLGKGVVALYTIIGKTTSEDNINNNAGNNNKINTGWILLVTPTIRKAYPIDTKDLEQTVFKFREALLSPNYDPQPLAQELYKKLFLQTSTKQKTTLKADLEETLGKEKDKTLMWSLDGILRYIPMSALHDGKGYLVEKYRNVVFNPASLGTLTAQTKSNWEVAGLGISTEGTVKAADGRMMRFVALKDSEIELSSLVKEKDGKDTEGIFPGTLKINNDFTKEALFDGARTGAPVMHISSHFWFNPAKEETSFLVLGNGEKIEMAEIQDYPNLFSNVDLLSLSACDTATGSASVAGKADGKETNGKEVEGFAYQAQSLGAKSVMASLWQVSALGTKELMLKFYQIKKEQPELPKGEALRQAQLSLLYGTDKVQTEVGAKGIDLGEQQKGVGLKPFKKDEKVPFAHPYYWSSFMLIGNWR